MKSLVKSEIIVQDTSVSAMRVGNIDYTSGIPVG